MLTNFYDLHIDIQKISLIDVIKTNEYYTMNAYQFTIIVDSNKFTLKHDNLEEITDFRNQLINKINKKHRKKHEKKNIKCVR